MTARLGGACLALALLLALPGCGSDEGDPSRAAAPELAGTSWALDTSGLGVAGAETVEAPLTFEQDGVAGSDGCNRIFGPYEQDGTSLRLGPLASTKMACTGPAGDVSERVLAALDGVASFSLDGDRLTLEDANGGPLLAYERAGAG